MDRITALETNLARQLHWIQAADSRLSFVVPLSTAMLGALAAITPSSACWTLATSTALVSAGLLIVSITFCALSSFPRTRGSPPSNLFFGKIAEHSSNDYCAKMKSFDEAAYVVDLAQQCYCNALIANQKYSWIKRAMAALFIATPFWTLSLYLVYQAP